VAQSTIRRILVRNTAWNYVGFGVNLAANLLLFPLAVARMGDAATGIWLLIGSISGYMGLLQLGLSPAMAQIAAAHIARDDKAALGRTVSTAMALVMSLGSLPLLVLPAVPWLLDIFGIPPALRADATIAFTLGIIGVPLQMPGHVFNAILGASQRQDRCTQVWIVSLVGKLVGITALLALGYGLAAVMWLETALILVADLLLVAMAFTSAPGLRLSARLVTRSDARELLSLGGWMFASSLSTLVIEQTDRIVIGLFLAVEFVTYYSAAWKLYMLVYAVSTTLVQAVWPVAAALHAHGDEEGLRRLWLRMTKYTVAVAWPLAWSLALTAGPVLYVWVGPAFAPYHHVVQVLLASFVVTAHNHVAFGILGAMRRVGPVARRYSIPQAVLNLGLSVWLVQSLGIFGVALGTVLPALALEYTFLAYAIEQVGLRWSDVWRDVVRPTALPALVSFTPALGVYAVLGPQSWWLPLAAALSSLAFAAMFWRSMRDGERAELVASLPAPIRGVLPA
jgi:O-antigen/teichoic acid export membrane protein